MPQASTPSPAQRAAPFAAHTAAHLPAPIAGPRRISAAASGAPATERLNKRMAALGLCSRREADDWIDKGWVKVNGVLAPMGLQVKPTDKIEVNPAARGQQQNQVTILLNKPMGFVSGQAEDGHEPAVTLIQAQNRWRDDRAHWRFSGQQLRGLAPAGRLDIDSIGLLVLTQDGRVARQLIGENSEVDKEYLVRVAYHGLDNPDTRQQQGVQQLVRMDDDDPITSNVQAVFPPAMLERLRHGLSLDGKALLPAQVTWQNPEQLRFVLREGKKRQIRRMCEQVGLKVVGLKRIRIGRVALGMLPIGQWRYLAPHEQF
jgi:23S rRNA pseudouridine2604 synthase